MAFVVPLIPYIAMATTAAAGVAAYRQQRIAGKFEQKQSEIDAAAEGDAARQREIDRKRGLLRAISSQQAAAAAAGISSSEGAQAKIAQLDTALSSNDLGVDIANTRQRQSSLLSQGRAARFAGDMGATVSLLDTAGRTYKALPGKK